MNVLLFTGDLIVLSRVEGAVAKLGVALESTSSADQVATVAGQHDIDVLIVDLDTALSDVGRLVAAVKTDRKDPPTVVAFGPHVHHSRLAAAREAGCDVVVSRGEFFSRVDDILAGEMP